MLFTGKHDVFNLDAVPLSVKNDAPTFVRDGDDIYLRLSAESGEQHQDGRCWKTTG